MDDMNPAVEEELPTDADSNGDSEGSEDTSAAGETPSTEGEDTGTDQGA